MWSWTQLMTEGWMLTVNTIWGGKVEGPRERRDSAHSRRRLKFSWQIWLKKRQLKINKLQYCWPLTLSRNSPELRKLPALKFHNNPRLPPEILMPRHLAVICAVDYGGGRYAGFTPSAADSLPQTSCTELPSGSDVFAELQLAIPQILGITLKKWELGLLILHMDRHSLARCLHKRG